MLMLAGDTTEQLNRAGSLSRQLACSAFLFAFLISPCMLLVLLHMRLAYAQTQYDHLLAQHKSVASQQ